MRTLFTLLLLVTATMIMAQEKQIKKRVSDDIYYTPQIKKDYEIKGSDKDQMARVVYCLDHYRKERGTAIGVGILGAAASVYSASLTGKDQKNMSYAAGGAFALSAILFLNSERWLSANKLIITPGGLAFRF